MTYEQGLGKLNSAMEAHHFIAHTRKRYRSIFRNVCEYSNVVDILSLTQDMADAFLEYKQTIDGCEPGTIRVFRTALKFIFIYALDRGEKQDVSRHSLIPVFQPLEGRLSLQQASMLMIQAMELRGMSQVSQKRYLESMRKFVKGVCKEEDLREITIYDAKNYIYHCRYTLNMTPGTCNARITVIKRLFTDVLQKEWPEDSVVYFRLAERLPVVLPREDVFRLLDAITNPAHRMAAILMYSAGLRVSEAIAVRVSDIRRETMQIFVEQGKGSKDRYAILSEACLNDLKQYWRAYRPTNYLFPGMRYENLHVSKHSVQDSITLAAEKLGFAGVTAHTLRHCFATHLVENNEDVFTVKDAMGHKRLNTTAKYVHLAGMSGLRVKSPYDR